MGLWPFVTYSLQGKWVLGSGRRAFARKGEKQMAFRQEFHPTDIDMVSEVLEAYCLAHGALSARERDEVGAALVALFQAGHQTPERLRTGLENRRAVDKQSMKSIHDLLHNSAGSPIAFQSDGCMRKSDKQSA